MKLLIIDDNAAVRTSLKLLLSDHFDEIATVGDPQLIPALIAPGNVDAVLLDMNFDNQRLDGSDGLFWLSRIKEMPDPPAVVLITAFGDVPLAVESMKRGAEDFISKPWDNDELISKLSNAIAGNKASKATKRQMEKARQIEIREQELDRMTLDELKMTHIKKVIEKCNGNLSAAASHLGINRQTLYNMLKKTENK